MFIEKKVKQKRKVGFICDKCNKSYTIIPDMSVVNITVCEECFYPFIKDHIK